MTTALLVTATLLLALVGAARVLVVSGRSLARMFARIKPRSRLERRIARRMGVIASARRRGVL